MITKEERKKLQEIRDFLKASLTELFDAYGVDEKSFELGLGPVNRFSNVSVGGLFEREFTIKGTLLFKE